MAGDGLDGDVLLNHLHLDRRPQGRLCQGKTLITMASTHGLNLQLRGGEMAPHFNSTSHHWKRHGPNLQNNLSSSFFGKGEAKKGVEA